MSKPKKEDKGSSVFKKLFGIRSERERMIDNIRSTQKLMKQHEAEAKRLKEDTIKMTKMVLNKGRIEKVKEETTEQPEASEAQSELQQSQPPLQPQSVPAQRLEQPPVLPQASEPVQQLPPAPEEAAALRQMMAQSQMPPQQFIEQPQVRQSVSQQSVEDELVPVMLSLYQDGNLTIDIPRSELKEFLSRLMEAIDNQTSVQFGNQVVNGRHIIRYVF